MKAKEQLADEFDKVALALNNKPMRSNAVQNNRRELFKHIPETCDKVLDIGCGLGSTVRYMAHRSKHVLGIDLSPQMIRIARERSTDFNNIEFQTADVLEYDLPPNHFDCILSFMTLHHMPLDAVFTKIKYALKPRGILIVKDACQQQGLINIAYSIPHETRRMLGKISQFIRGKKLTHLMRHDPNEVHPTFEDVFNIASEMFPGAQIKQEYGLKKYTLIWKKE